MSEQTGSKREVLRLEAWRNKSKLSETISYMFLLFGVTALAVSIIYESPILAFVGLGLTFWGALLLFIRPTKLVRVILLESTALSSLTTIDRIINDLKYEGKAIYLPPRFLKGLKGGTIFVPSRQEIVIPAVEEVAEEKVFLSNPNGICLTPLGLGLANLYEKELGKDFAKVSFNYLQDKLPRLFIEDLEIAEDLEMSMENNVIQVKVTGSIYTELCKEAKKLRNICCSLGCPLCSSVAIALTRATGKPIIIENTNLSEDDKTIEVNYRIIEE